MTPLKMIAMHLNEITRLGRMNRSSRSIISQAEAALSIINGLPNPTPTQLRVLDFIKAYYADHEFMPSFAEITAGLGYASKSSAYRLVHGLVKKGLLIAPIPGQARSMRLPA